MKIAQCRDNKEKTRLTDILSFLAEVNNEFAELCSLPLCLEGAHDLLQESVWHSVAVPIQQDLPLSCHVF